MAKKKLGFARVTQVGNMPQDQQPNDSISKPYFQYYVQSEKGIKLYVDFNFTTYDHCKQMDHQFLMNQSLENNKFQSFRQELESLGSNSNNQAKKSLNLETNEENLSNQIVSYTESCHNVRTKSKSDGSETTNMMVHQGSKVDNENPNGVYSGCSTIGSKEFQMTEVASIEKKQHGFDRSDEFKSNGTVEWESKKNPVSRTETSNNPDNTTYNVRRKRKTADVEISDNSTSGGNNDGRVVLRSGKLIGQSLLRRSMRLVYK